MAERLLLNEDTEASLADRLRKAGYDVERAVNVDDLVEFVSVFEAIDAQGVTDVEGPLDGLGVEILDYSPLLSRYACSTNERCLFRVHSV